MPLYKPLLRGVSIKEVLRYAGGEGLPESMARAALAEAFIYAQPRGAWEVYDYQARGYDKSQDLLAYLDGSERVAAIAVSVGGAIEDRIDALFKAGEYTAALLLDAAATAAVERAADSVLEFIDAAASKDGLLSCGRFSPGYGDWDVKEQPYLLRLSGADKIGVGLTASFMLTPRKSITAFAGLKPVGEKAPRGCARCANFDCQFRRV